MQHNLNSSAHQGNPDSLKRCQKAAALAAAAPDLLNALCTLMGALETDCMDDKSNTYRSAMINARTAIKKATKPAQEAA